MIEEQTTLPLEEGEKPETAPAKAAEVNLGEIIGEEPLVVAPAEGQPLMLIGSTGSLDTAIAQGHIVEHTVSLAPRPGPRPEKDTIPVRIKYPAGWKKQKFFKDGDIKEVAKETADQFVKAGFATIIKEDKK